MTTTKKTLTLTLVVAVAIASVATVTQADPSAPSDSAPAAPSSAAALDASSLHVFRRAEQPGDALPAGVRTMLTPTAEREGVTLDQARAVAAIGTSSVWVVPGAKDVCVAIPDPVDGYGVNCKSYARAAAGELWVALVGGADQSVGDARMALVVPDGVASVTAVASDGTRRELAVSDNVAVADLVSSDKVEFTDAGGTLRSTRIPGTPRELVADR